MNLLWFLLGNFIVAEASLLIDNQIYDRNNSILQDVNGTDKNVEDNSQIPHVKHAESKWFRSKDLFLRDRYYNPPLMDINLKYCQRPAKCQVLNYSTCMGSKLPYYHTTLNLTDLSRQEKVQEKLQLYQYLRYIPKCWAVIQPFLCALYMPKCTNEDVDLPSREMCRIIQSPCKILFNTTIFPEFINCDDERLFPSKCKNDIHEVKFNTTGFCMEPLVRTDQPEWFFPDVDTCGLQCKDVLYTEDEHQQIHKLMIHCILFCIASNLFAIITFVIEWNTANKYPALAVFYINVCFFISYCGWLAQFLGSGTREDIVCKKDGTLRKYEPSANENLSCVSVFVMVYYFLIAGMVWFVIFIYAWYMSSLQALGKIQERVDKKRAYFHLVAWSLPLILTITTMALGEIDGDYVLGICFVGFVNPASRIGLLLAPLGAAMIAAGYIVIRGLLLLIRVKIDSRDVISEHSSRKIKWNILRMAAFAICMGVFCIITFAYHAYIFKSSKILSRPSSIWKWISRLWSSDLRIKLSNVSLVIPANIFRGYSFADRSGLTSKTFGGFVQEPQCKLTSLSSDYSHCKIETRPSVAMLQLQLLAVFGSGIAMASWVWCPPTYHVWNRFLRRKFKCKVNELRKFQRHQIIAQAFEKRKKYHVGRPCTLEAQPHSDPVGLNFDINSAATFEVSTTWAEKLPRLITRRGALPEIETHSLSVTSNYSLQQISIESRRNSGESQLSVQISEVTAKINGRMHRNKVRQKRFNRGRSRRSKGCRKKGSTTSLDSHFGMQLLDIFSNTSNCKNVLPNLNKRRAGNAGLDDENLNNFLTNTQLMLPYEKNMKSESEDENVSVTISESKFNIVVNNCNRTDLDLSDQLIMKSLYQDLRIKELHSSNGSLTSHNSESDSDSSSSSSSSCRELKQLLQSSLNSADSTVTQNRASKQSKTSIDVAVQTNDEEIASQMAPLRTDVGSESKKHNKKKWRIKKK